jgi:hypothetical protein
MPFSPFLSTDDQQPIKELLGELKQGQHRGTTLYQPQKTSAKLRRSKPRSSSCDAQGVGRAERLPPVRPKLGLDLPAALVHCLELAGDLSFLGDGGGHIRERPEPLANPFVCLLQAGGVALESDELE